MSPYSLTHQRFDHPLLHFSLDLTLLVELLLLPCLLGGLESGKVFLRDLGRQIERKLVGSALGRKKTIRDRQADKSKRHRHTSIATLISAMLPCSCACPTVHCFISASTLRKLLKAVTQASESADAQIA